MAETIKRMGLGLGLALLLVAGKDADHRRAQDLGIVDPLLGLGDFRVPLLARRMAEVVADRRARDIQPQPKALPPQRRADSRASCPWESSSTSAPSLPSPTSRSRR